MKKISILASMIIVALIVIVTISGCGFVTLVDSESENNVVVNEAIVVEETRDEIEEKAVEEKLSFTLVAGEQGEYGHPFSINVGTEFEENYFVYRIPEGTYKATNVGKYMNQINVYSDEIHVTEAGWEEKTPFFVALLNVNESTTFTIEEGQHVDICKPAEILLEKQ